ncbi:MAG: flagellar GTP-binding protein [Opitutae bacterium]|nr:flagellar GTP-binding protein [Opitutae bacterium]
MNLAPPAPPPAGTCCRFLVDSADEAATLIRAHLGEHARVLSVRSVESPGWKRLLAVPKLEVIAQIDPPAGEKADEPAAPDPAAPVSPRRLAEAPPCSLPELLRRSGFSAGVLERMERRAGWADLVSGPLHRGLVEVGRQLCAEVESRPARPPLGRAAFLGAPGSGRSTALCKWLAAEVYRRARLGHVVMAEFDRPSASGPLPVFCEALGVPLAHYPAGTRPAVPGGFVYFDLPGLSLRDAADNANLTAFLEQEEIAERVLVVNAAYETAALRRVFAAGRGLAATHVVFTHLDEVRQWGRLWDHLIESELEPLFLSTGPSLTGECETEAAQALARRTLSFAD